MFVDKIKTALCLFCVICSQNVIDIFETNELLRSGSAWILNVQLKKILKCLGVLFTIFKRDQRRLRYP